MEYSFFLVKPDAFKRGLVGEVIKRIENKGLSLEQLEVRTADEALAAKHYAEHKGKDFYDSLIDFITSGPLVAGIISGEKAVEAFRQLAGKTDPVTAATPGTIRGDFGLVVQQNLVHGSDSVEAAKREIGTWFPNFKF